MEKKTTRIWLESLPEPNRTLALENTKEYKADILDRLEDGLDDAILGAFIWCKTEQGFDHWYKVYHESEIIIVPKEDEKPVVKLNKEQELAERELRLTNRENNLKAREHALDVGIHRLENSIGEMTHRKMIDSIDTIQVLRDVVEHYNLYQPIDKKLQVDFLTVDGPERMRSNIASTDGSTRYRVMITSSNGTIAAIESRQDMKTAALGILRSLLSMGITQAEIIKEAGESAEQDRRRRLGVQIQTPNKYIKWTKP